jgi:hypothetical protein
VDWSVFSEDEDDAKRNARLPSSPPETRSLVEEERVCVAKVFDAFW